jgi:hypothetical protein
MLGLAAAAERRRRPLAEATIAAGLWIYVLGLGAETDAVAAAGVAVMTAGFAPVAVLFARVVRRGRIGIREGPVAHVAVGIVFLLEAAVLGVAGALGGIDGRRAGIAAVILLGLGWAVGVILGHLGKLVSLSGWGSWPPGPRPSQQALYPRRIWQLEVAVFAVGVELVAAGVLFDSSLVARGGSSLLVAAATAASAGVAETLRRVTTLRRAAGS